MKNRLFSLLFATFSLFVFSTAQAQLMTSTTPAWRIVPNDQVCMVTNAYFDKPQIPVPHNKKTYYGCCEGCKTTLQQDAASRSALDPLSGKSVDKATAIIAANPNGAVLYFESKASFQKYLKKTSN